MPGNVQKRFPRDLGLLVKEHSKRLHRHFEICGAEVVADVPPERPKFASLLHNRVEEGQAKEQFLPFAWFRAAIELLLSDRRPRALQVCSNPFRRLESHFHRRL